MSAGNARQFGAATHSSVIRAMWEVSRREAPDDLIEWIGGGSFADEVTMRMRHLSEVVEGIGCLIAYDASSQSPSGNFQSGDDVPALLFNIAEQIASLGELANVASDAAYCLAHPEHRDTYRRRHEPEAEQVPTTT